MAVLDGHTVIAEKGYQHRKQDPESKQRAQNAETCQLQALYHRFAKMTGPKQEQPHDRINGYDQCQHIEKVKIATYQDDTDMV